MTARLFSGERRIAAVDPRDRGFAYGDGVFETLLVDRGRVAWWDAHRDRLLRGCATLGIAPPDPAFLRREADELAAGCARGVLKLIVTRGAGTRGYAPDAAAVPTTVLSLSAPPPDAPRDGLVLRWCTTTLALQPRLAGIKHLNRLEQVLARAEWTALPDGGAGIDEGLVCDTRGRVVGATSANLFVRREGRWLTPPVVACGIAGTCRDWILRHVPDAGESELARADVESADALVLCNAVRGILSVAALGEQRWPASADVAALQRRLADAEPAFHVATAPHDPPED